MHQMTRTLAFVIAASASVIGAVVAHIVTRPEVATDQAHTLIGQPFFPDFTDPTKPTGIRVAAWSPVTSKVEQFEVRYENGQWRIPSHNNYPADGKDQLAKAAASAVGIVRGSLSAKSADGPLLQRLGVVDPLDENVTQGAGTSGTRITLFQGDEVVADYIIGHKFGAVEATEEDAASDSADSAGKQSKEGRYYVRRPDEKLVYLADVKIDVSTKFRDWIQKDLLDLTQSDLREMTINRYSIDEERGVRVPGDRSELSRASASDPWKLKGLDESKEKVKPGVVSAMARALDNLQIIGVRRKPAALIEFFSKGTVSDVLQMIAAQSDMQRHGYFFTERDLLSNEGEFLAGTKDGVRYVLRFGEVFTGSDLEIEVGGPAESSDKPADAGQAQTAVSATTGDQTADGQPAAESQQQPADKTAKRSRYVIVEAILDPTLLGPEPTPPVKPTAPATSAPAAPPANESAPAASTPDAAAPQAAPPANPSSTDAAPPASESNCDDAATAQTPAAAETPAAPAAAGDAPVPAAAATGTTEPPPAERPKTPQDIYQEALRQYEQDQEAYEAQLKDYQQRLKDAQKRVDDLNKRFAEWYYVISAEVYEDLRVSREQLVEPVTPPADAALPATDAAPEPGASPEAEPAAVIPPPAATTPAATTPPATTPAAEPAAPATEPSTPPATEPPAPAADAAPPAEAAPPAAPQQ